MDNSNKAFEKIVFIITKINEILLLIAISAMFIFVFANVIGRYVFSNSISWAAEVSRYLMVSVAFLGMGLAMKQSRHSAFYIFQDLFPTLPRKIIRILVAIIIIAIMVLLLLLGFQYALKYMSNLTEVLRWPVGYWYLTIPIGAFLFIFHFLTTIKEYVNKKKDADLEAEILAGDELVEDSVFYKSVTEGEIEESDKGVRI
ncbi:MAG: TRAP transporter small permease [Clostridiales bacterium]|nr:TRAP transporter small permease [Clostridiales bacterium]